MSNLRYFFPGIISVPFCYSDQIADISSYSPCTGFCVSERQIFAEVKVLEVAKEPCPLFTAWWSYSSGKLICLLLMRRRVDRVESCWGSCYPHFFYLFRGSKSICQSLFPLTWFTFHVRFIYRLVHPAPLGNALAHTQITTPPLWCWGTFSTLCSLTGPQNRVRRGS